MHRTEPAASAPAGPVRFVDLSTMDAAAVRAALPAAGFERADRLGLPNRPRSRRTRDVTRTGELSGRAVAIASAP
ncbi:hypothetical protein ABT297_38725 [Dactylosporangium sp. NPDC000555]|uniref:hypothetical protein n=1 Tax=Dactylosporangium sp. NPDC000555 TaxID=3154260 RepID=UPI00331B2A24